MAVSEDITEIKIEDELRRCPTCGYDHGFHTSFLRVHGRKETPVKSTHPVVNVILICPNCGSRYDVGWRITVNECDDAIPKTTMVQHISSKMQT